MVVIRRVRSNSNQMRAITLSVMMMFGQFMIIPFFESYTWRMSAFTEGWNLTYVYMAGGALRSQRHRGLGTFLINRKPPDFLPFSLFLNVNPDSHHYESWSNPILLFLMVSTMFFVTSMPNTWPRLLIITGTARPENRRKFSEF